MRRTKLTKIRSETRETILIRQINHHARILWCVDCGADTLWRNALETSFICGTSIREVFRQVETGSIHFRETADHQLLVCERSLSKTKSNDTSQDSMMNDKALKPNS